MSARGRSEALIPERAARRVVHEGRRVSGDIEQVIPARRRDLGGFEVGRVLPAGRRRMVGPFIFFDHIGPATLPPPLPRAMDVRPHPHIGLSTVTYLFDGEMTHRDSLGCEQVIRPAEVNWMTAGRGISHSERFEGMRERGGVLHGIQAWVALPAEHEEIEPAFEHYARDSLPLIEGEGWSARVIAGELLGARSAVRTHSPLLYAHSNSPQARASRCLPTPPSAPCSWRRRGRHRRTGVHAGADAGARTRRDADDRRPRGHAR